MHDQLNRRVHPAGSLVINGANTITWDPGFPVKIVRVVLVYTTGNTTPGNGVTAQRRPVAGAAANQVTLGTFVTTATTAAGDVDYLDVGIDVAQATGVDNSKVNVARIDWIIYPGQDFALVSDGAGAAGVCDVYIEYVLLPWGNRTGGAGVIKKLTQAT